MLILRHSKKNNSKWTFDKLYLYYSCEKKRENVTVPCPQDVKKLEIHVHYIFNHTKQMISITGHHKPLLLSLVPLL